MNHYKLLKYIVLAFVFVAFVPAKAQVPQYKKIVDSLRQDVYNRVMNLNDAEKKAFWEIHNKMQAELDDITLERMRARVQLNRQSKKDGVKKEEVLTMMNKVFDLQDKENNIKRTYYPQILDAIPTEKAILMPKAEREFKKQMLEKLKKARNRLQE
jgi:hypothetical protein